MTEPSGAVVTVLPNPTTNPVPDAEVPVPEPVALKTPPAAAIEPKSGPTAEVALVD